MSVARLVLFLPLLLLAVSGYVPPVGFNPTVVPPAMIRAPRLMATTARTLLDLRFLLTLPLTPGRSGTGNVVGSEGVVNVRDILAYARRSAFLPATAWSSSSSGYRCLGLRDGAHGAFLHHSCSYELPWSGRSVAASIVLAPVYPSFNIHEVGISRKYGVNATSWAKKHLITMHRCVCLTKMQKYITLSGRRKNTNLCLLDLRAS